MGGGGKVRIQHHCVAFSPAGNVINLEFGTPTPNVSLKKRLYVSPMRKLQSTAAGIPTVSQDTMLNSQEEARRRKTFSINMTWRRTNRRQTEVRGGTFLGSSHMKSISSTVWDFAHSPVYTSCLCFICLLTTDNEKAVVLSSKGSAFFFTFCPQNLDSVS